MEAYYRPPVLDYDYAGAKLVTVAEHRRLVAGGLPMSSGPRKGIDYGDLPQYLLLKEEIVRTYRSRVADPVTELLVAELRPEFVERLLRLPDEVLGLVGLSRGRLADPNRRYLVCAGVEQSEVLERLDENETVEIVWEDGRVERVKMKEIMERVYVKYKIISVRRVKGVHLDEADELAVLVMASFRRNCCQLGLDALPQVLGMVKFLYAYYDGDHRRVNTVLSITSDITRKHFEEIASREIRRRLEMADLKKLFLSEKRREQRKLSEGGRQETGRGRSGF